MTDVLTELEREYCPPLDPALLSAILSDYDISNTTAVAEARATLDELRISALCEEEAGFDPSGTGAVGFNDETGLDGEQQRPESCPDTAESTSRDTDLTSLSNGLGALDISRAGDLHKDEQSVLDGFEDVEALDDETKVLALQSVFGKQVNMYTIKYTLRKCNGKFHATVEELLNHVYFEEAVDEQGTGRIGTKSVDAFTEDNTARRGRKSKYKDKNLRKLQERRSSSLPTSPDDSPGPGSNKWKSAAEEIAFIATRTSIPTATVSSTYYDKGASMPQTIAALLKNSMGDTKSVDADVATIAPSARELGQDFPTIAPDYLTTLIRLTYPSTTAAHELAKALTAKPRSTQVGGIEVIPQYAPLDGIGSDSDDMAPRQSSNMVLADLTNRDPGAAAARKTAYALAQARAFSQASAAHRKAKSDRLMGGAAAYYGQIGLEYAALSSQASAAAADALAASQSTASELDLHGIDVLNAVRIACDKVEKWWERLGENRINGRVGAEYRSAGYRIVVGLGRHSEGGKGKLGPAVSKALREEGWKVEAAGAVLVVKGKI